MSITQDDVDLISQLIAPVVGRRAWGASLGHGSFVTMEFGDRLPPSARTGAVHGEWHLWIQHCDWRIEQDGLAVAESEDQPRAKLEAAVRGLDGHVLRSIEIVPPGTDSLLTFDGGIIMRLFPDTNEGYEHWWLFMPSGDVLVIGPNSGWSVRPRSQ